MASKHNAERSIRGRSHRKGGARISELKSRVSKGEYYAELDEETGLYCVFNTERDGHAFSSWADVGAAEGDASVRNGG